MGFGLYNSSDFFARPALCRYFSAHRFRNHAGHEKLNGLQMHSPRQPPQPPRLPNFPVYAYNSPSLQTQNLGLHVPSTFENGIRTDAQFMYPPYQPAGGFSGPSDQRQGNLQYPMAPIPPSTQEHKPNIFSSPRARGMLDGEAPYKNGDGSNPYPFLPSNGNGIMPPKVVNGQSSSTSHELVPVGHNGKMVEGDAVKDEDLKKVGETGDENLTDKQKRRKAVRDLTDNQQRREAPPFFLGKCKACF